jgi:transposase-like protein
VLTDTGRMEIDVLRDRLATFDPQLIAKYRRRLPGFAALPFGSMTRSCPCMPAV